MRDIEKWILRTVPQDKCLHALVGVLIFSVAHSVSWQVGIATVLVAGVAKELLDHFTGGDVSVWDVAATLSGGMLGLLCFAR